MDGLKLIDDARKELILGQPFFGVLALKLEARANPAHPSMRTDGRALEFNPDWIESLPSAQLRAVVAHEVMHLAMGHHARGRGLDHKLWNQACDFAVNAELAKCGFELPKDALLDPRYDGLTEESIYKRLAEDQPAPDGTPKPQGGTGDQPGQGQPGFGGQDFGGCGEVLQAGADEASAADALAEWRENAAEAIRAASSAGQMPGNVKRVVNLAAAPKADFADRLRRFMNDRVKVTSTWARPDRRFLAAGLYLPGRRPVGMGRLVIGVDTSSSITQPLLDRIGATVSEIAIDCEPAETVVIYCDSSVKHVDVYQPGEVIKLTAHGGGGTRFAPVFEHVSREELNPVAMIYLTDLEGPMPEEPAYPVLWGVFGQHGPAPWGETVPLE